MLNDALIVQSALSAFNNAALIAPAFMWWALLATPLFVLIARCSDGILQKLGWTHENILGHITTWTAGLTLLWVVLFSGNYGVLRDGLSVLPMMVATIIFLTSLFVSSHLRRRPIPHLNRWQWLLVILFICAVALSNTNSWWGPLLQVGALALGAGLGRAAKADMRPIGGCILIMLAVVTAILMQPEFFRFGQLGNLTPFHLLTVLFMGIVSVATIALTNVHPSGKIRHDVYTKLKWLMRVVCALGGALFILTEAVPVFLGTMVAIFLSFALSIRHQTHLDSVLGYKMLSFSIFIFGLITVMPAVSVLGILYWTCLPPVKVWLGIKPLL